MTVSKTSPPVSGRWTDWKQRQFDRFAVDHWRVGIVDAPIHVFLQPGAGPSIRWITPDERKGYWADPFGLPGNTSQIFAERFDEDSGLGRLERLSLDGNIASTGLDSSDLAPVGRGLHTSFPHVFESDGALYAIAETGAAKECVLYKVDSNGKWHSPEVIMSGIAAADPAIFKLDNRYWLALTDTARGFYDNLCLYHSDNLKGPWVAHTLNPVKTGLGGSRMAGNFFEHGGSLYRSGQDCRTTYGAAVMMYRVDECTPTAYIETFVRAVLPDASGPVPDGLHTLTSWGNRTLVDGKRKILNFRSIARRIKKRLIKLK